MRFAESLRNYWFREHSYFDLAVLRVGATGLQLYLLLSHTFNTLARVNSLPDDLYAPRIIVQILALPWGSGIRPDPDFMLALFWLIFALGIASFIGFLTNLSLSLFAVGYVFLQGYIYSFGDIHHPEAIMAIGLLALAASPCGKVLSVDSLLKGKFRPGTGTVSLLDYSGKYAWWPIGMLQWFIPMMYLSAVIMKIGRSGLDWANGFTLQYKLIQDGYRYGSELAIWLSQFHDFIKAVEWLVILFQATFFLVIFFPRLRWIYLPLGICFHLAIYFTLRAPFPQWLLFYAVYIPWARVFRNLAAKRVVVGDAPAAA